MKKQYVSIDGLKEIIKQVTLTEEMVSTHVKDDCDIVADDIRSQIRSIMFDIETNFEKYSDKTYELIQELEESLAEDERQEELKKDELEGCHDNSGCFRQSDHI